SVVTRVGADVEVSIQIRRENLPALLVSAATGTAEIRARGAGALGPDDVTCSARGAQGISAQVAQEDVVAAVEAALQTSLIRLVPVIDRELRARSKAQEAVFKPSAEEK